MNQSMYLDIATLIFSKWPTLQIAAQYLPGRVSLNDKIQTLAQRSCEILANGRSDEDTLIGWLSQTMYDEFDLLLEDHSDIAVAKSLIDAWNKCQTAYTQESLMIDHERLLQIATPSNVVIHEESINSEDQDSTSNDDDDDQNFISADPQNKSSQQNMIDADGWETVTRRRR